MKGLRRFCTLVLGILLLAGGALALLCVNNSGIRSYWADNFAYIINNFWIGTVVGIALAVLGVLAIIIGVYVKRSVPFAKVSMGEFGQVDISLAAVDTVVKKVAGSIEGVNNIKTRIKSDKSGVSVLLDVVMGNECNIPETVALLQQNVKEQLENTVGLTVSGVRTAITNISSN